MTLILQMLNIQMKCEDIFSFSETSLNTMGVGNHNMGKQPSSYIALQKLHLLTIYLLSQLAKYCPIHV